MRNHGYDFIFANHQYPSQSKTSPLYRFISNSEIRRVHD